MDMQYQYMILIQIEIQLKTQLNHNGSVCTGAPLPFNNVIIGKETILIFSKFQ